MTTEQKLDLLVASVTEHSKLRNVTDLTPVFDALEKISEVEQVELLAVIIDYYGTYSWVKSRNKQIESGMSRECFSRAKDIIYSSSTLASAAKYNSSL